VIRHLRHARIEMISKTKQLVFVTLLLVIEKMRESMWKKWNDYVQNPRLPASISAS
jgi:hypothetical protein